MSASVAELQQFELSPQPRAALSKTQVSEKTEKFFVRGTLIKSVCTQEMVAEILPLALPNQD